MKTAVTACLLALGALASGCSKTPRPKGPWRSVILITVDTLRADHLGCYGYSKPTSPNLDALAAGGARFERTLVSVPRTTQSLASILTGRTPATTNVRYLTTRLPAEVDTLAERFAAAGFATGAFVVVPFFLNKMGFGQGFGDDFEKFGNGEDVRADQVTDAALAWLARHQDQPYFLWLHYRDPHAPYYPPKRCVDRIDPDYQGDVDVFHYWPVDASGEALPGLSANQRDERKGRYKFGVDRYSDEDVRRAIALYDGEIAFVDEQIGRLRQGLQQFGRADDTVISLTADHGESLGEHDFWFDHGEFLYDATLRVPLLIAAPGIAPITVSTQVAAIDLAPTLLDMFGLPPFAGAQGRSFLPALQGEPAEDRAVFAESGEPLMWQYNPRRRGRTDPPAEPADRLRAWARDRNSKVIFDPLAETGGLQYFQPTQDPAESRDQAQDPRAAPLLKAARGLLQALVNHDLGLPPPPELDPEQKKWLNQQGY